MCKGLTKKRVFGKNSSILTVYNRKNNAIQLLIESSGLAYTTQDLNLMTDKERAIVLSKIKNIKKTNDKKYIGFVDDLRAYIMAVEAATTFRYEKENLLGYYINEWVLRSVATIIAVFYHADEILPTVNDVLDTVSRSKSISAWTEKRNIGENEILMAIEMMGYLDLSTNQSGLNRWQTVEHLDSLFKDNSIIYRLFEYMGYKATGAANSLGVFLNWSLGK